MSNIHLSEAEATTNADRARLARASTNSDGGMPRIFQRFFQKQETAEQQIERLQREVADAHAAAVGLKSKHDRLIAAVGETRSKIANTQERIAILTEKRQEPEAHLFHKVTSRSQANADVLRWSGELAAIDAALAQCRGILDRLQAELPAQASALSEFERTHRDDLEPASQ